jgi:hypothetical protein
MIKGGMGMGWADKAAILGFAMPLGRGAQRYFSSLRLMVKNLAS